MCTIAPLWRIMAANHAPAERVIVMLVKFDSKVGTFTMFGDSAVALLKMMGHSGTVPGAILAEDMPRALERLKQAVAQASELPAHRPGAERAPDADDNELRVSLRQRAFPLIELLEAAAQRGCSVMWRRE